MTAACITCCCCSIKSPTPETGLSPQSVSTTNRPAHLHGEALRVMALVCCCGVLLHTTAGTFHIRGYRSPCCSWQIVQCNKYFHCATDYKTVMSWTYFWSLSNTEDIMTSQKNVGEVIAPEGLFISERRKSTWLLLESLTSSDACVVSRDVMMYRKPVENLYKYMMVQVVWDVKWFTI